MCVRLGPSLINVLDCSPHSSCTPTCSVTMLVLDRVFFVVAVDEESSVGDRLCGEWWRPRTVPKSRFFVDIIGGEK